MFGVVLSFCSICQVSYQDILKVLDASKVCSSVQNFTDVYLRLPGVPFNGQLTEGECIRVRICEGRFALLIREVCKLIILFHLCFFVINLLPFLFPSIYASLYGKEILLSSQRLILISVPALSQGFLSLGKWWTCFVLSMLFTCLEENVLVISSFESWCK